MFYKLLLILITSLFISCNGSGEFFQIIHKFDSLPTVTEKPLIHHFSYPGAISLSWKVDYHADSYILYRSDTATGTYSKVYQGDRVNFLDNSLPLLTTLYFYKLSKVRNDQEYALSDATPAFISPDNEDIYEPNNNKENETLLNTRDDFICNSYYFQGTGVSDVIDTDYFYSYVYPGEQEDVIIWIENNPFIYPVTIPQADGLHYVNTLTGEDSILNFGTRFYLHKVYTNATTQVVKNEFSISPNLSTATPWKNSIRYYKITVSIRKH